MDTSTEDAVPEDHSETFGQYAQESPAMGSRPRPNHRQAQIQNIQPFQQWSGFRNSILHNPLVPTNSMLHNPLVPTAAGYPPTAPDTRHRLRHFRDTRRTMTEGLLNANEDLLDLATDLQARVAALELENEYLRNGQAAPSHAGFAHVQQPYGIPISASGSRFAVVLLDADCYHFRHEFTVDGANGGRRAADELYSRVSDYLRQECNLPASEPVQVILKAYAYQHGLSNALQRVGLIKSDKDFELFIEGFNQRIPLFDYSNVGSGKERADNKIREWLQHYLEQPQCQHIVLGCGHDTGYETFLQKFAASEIARERITMLDGPIMSINFRSLGFSKRLAMWSVFASTPVSRNTKGGPPQANTPKATASASVQSGSSQPATMPAKQYHQAQRQAQQASAQPQSGQKQANSAKGPKSQNNQQRQSSANTGKGKQQQASVQQGQVTAQTSQAPEKSDVEPPSASQTSSTVSLKPDSPRPGIWQSWWERLSGSTVSR